MGGSPKSTFGCSITCMPREGQMIVAFPYDGHIVFPQTKDHARMNFVYR